MWVDPSHQDVRILVVGDACVGQSTSYFLTLHASAKCVDEAVNNLRRDHLVNFSYTYSLNHISHV
jgi:hypothetical protein